MPFDPLRQSKAVWVAPMAGGPSCPELVIAAARAGHLAQLAGGYKTAPAMMAEIRAVREAGVDLFGVNLFVPNPHAIALDDYEAYAQSLTATARRLGANEGWPAPREDDDEWDAKIAALVADPVPLVSFTFGLPSADALAQLRAVGTITMQTVTSPDEAQRAEQAEVDLLLVQGFAAGGHSGVWDAGRLPADIPLTALVAAVRRVARLPIVAAGGIATAEEVSAPLAAGAAAVVVGTAVVRAAESGASATHKIALADERFESTTLTRAFTGRPARALVNEFVREHSSAPSGYPALHHLTRPLRAAAAAAGDSSALNLWAGQGWRRSREAPVADILEELLPLR